MEFEEIKSAWHIQDNEQSYFVNEQLLFDRIRSKTAASIQLAGLTEWLLMLINLGAGIVLFVDYRSYPGSNIFLLLEALWLLGIVIYFAINSVRRMKEARRFDRSIRGDLEHAIFLADYQVLAVTILPVSSTSPCCSTRRRKFCLCSRTPDSASTVR